MKQIIKEYYEEIKDLLKNKTFSILILLVTILSYGFTITHYSIGIDDLCFDKYVTGTYIISAGRWGTALIYNLLGITNFSPFWLDLIVTILTVILGLIFTTFIKRNFSKELNIWHYIIITSIIISFPILSLSFIFQSTNLSVIISNIYLMCIPIIIYELFKNKKMDIPTIIFLGLTLPFFISMYESCCQTFVVLTFIITFLYAATCTKEERKKIIKYVIFSMTALIIGIIVNFIMCKCINFILEQNGRLTYNYAYKLIPWTDSKYDMNILFKKYFTDPLISEIQYTYYIRNFFILFIITFIIALIKSIKTKNIYLIPSLFIILLSGFFINLIQGYFILRINTSWIFTLGFMVAYILTNINNKKTNTLISVLLLFIIFLQTRTLNQDFYNDYIRYKKEENYAYSIAYEIINTCVDTSKPIVYYYSTLDGKHQIQINEVNGKSLFNWGSGGFEIPGEEITKFINSLGFNFNISDKNLQEEATTDIKNRNLILYKNQRVYESDNYILVLFNINI